MSFSSAVDALYWTFDDTEAPEEELDEQTEEDSNEG